jgi:serine/threonine-protein kinase
VGNDVRIGTSIGGYAVDSLLGRGGMSVVYLAEDPKLGRKVALKIMSEELAENESFRSRFIREAQMAANLEHPSIVPVYDAGDADGVLYLAMRVIRGTDLRRVVTEGGPMDAERTLRILRQIASALDAAHRSGLVHRDVKPANVLISREGDDEHAYLTDFGLTKHVSSKSGLTRTGQFMGTIDYVAPEQIRGNDVDGRTDQYSLGCVLYECLTGHVPFTKDQDVAILFAHLEDERPRVSAKRPDLPAGLDDVVARAMGRDPSERFDTCTAFVTAARESLGLGRGASAAAAETLAPVAPTVFAAPPAPAEAVPEPHPSFPPGDPSAPPEVEPAGTGAAMAATVAAASLASAETGSVEVPSPPTAPAPPMASPVSAPPAGAPAEPAPGRSRRGLVVVAIVALLAIVGTVGALVLGDGGESEPSLQPSQSPSVATGPTGATAPVESPTPSPSSVVEEPPVRAPLNARAISTSTTSVVLEWGVAPNGSPAVQFLILRDGEQIGKTKGSTFTDETVTASTPYVYQIVAVGEDGSKARSDEVRVTTPAPASSGGGGCTGIVLPNGDCIPA